MATEYETYTRAADLYDVAFSWDVGAEVDWLLQRFGPNTRRLLEPACGSGRMFPAFAQRGVEVVGVEGAAEMIAAAERRMRTAGFAPPTIHHGDMTQFDLGTRFDGALCPINSFGYLLSWDEALSHLNAVARHLRPGGKYLLQVDLLDTSVSVEYGRDDSTTWEAEVDGVRVRCTWAALSFDAGTRCQTERSRFEVLDGPGAGRVVEEDHLQRKWNWPEWQALIAAAPLQQVAAYDAGAPARWQPLPLNDEVEDSHLTWHELVVPLV